MTQYRQVATRAQRLRAEAAEAAEVRDALTHPDVVALRVEKLRTVVDRFIWTGMVLGLLFTMTNVQQFTADTTGAGPGSLGWWASWLLDPTVSVILLGVLLAERVVSRLEVTIRPWARTAKWSLLAATYVMNTWESWAAGNVAGIVLHSVPPLAVFMGAEALTDCQEMLTECVHRAHAAAATRATERAEARRALAEDAAHAAGADRDSRVKDVETDTRIRVLRSEADVTVASNTAAATTRTGPVVVGETVSGRSGTAARNGLQVVPARPEFTPAVRPGPTPQTVPQTGPQTARQDVPDRQSDRSAGRPADRSGPSPQDVPQTGPATPGRTSQDAAPDRSDKTVPDRSGTARRNGPGHRKQTGKRPRSDEQLVAELRDRITALGGVPPSVYQVKQALGVGSDRAARLLDLATTAADGDTARTGTARQETSAK